MRKLLLISSIVILLFSCTQKWTNEQEDRFINDCKNGIIDQMINFRGMEGKNIDIEKSCLCTMKNLEEKYSNPPRGFDYRNLCLIRTKPLNTRKSQVN